MDLKNITQNFLQELTNAHTGKESSLPFIPNPLPSSPIVKDGEIFQVIVIGGSVFRKALVKKVEGQIIILKQELLAQPKYPTKESLFTFLENHIADTVEKVCLNFAYPMKPQSTNGVLDGVLIRGVKENAFDGLAGEVVGESLSAYFLEKKGKKIIVSVANDTVCLLLSGLLQNSADDLACGIDGTGINFAIFQDTKTAVNLEASDFDKFTLTEAAKYVDEHSQLPGNHPVEKEASGAYLYQQFNFYLEKNNISQTPITSTEELHRVALSGEEQLAQIAQKLLNHSAELVACFISGIMLYQKRSLTFIMIGSLFWKGNQYKEMVEKTCATLAPDYTPTFVEVEHADILGGAKLLS